MFQLKHVFEMCVCGGNSAAACQTSSIAERYKTT